MLYLLTGRTGSGKTWEVFRRMAAEGAAVPNSSWCPNRPPLRPSGASAGKTATRPGPMGEVLSLHPPGKPGPVPDRGRGRPRPGRGGAVTLAMYAALKSVQDHLTVYAMPSRRPEFLDSLLTTLDELKSSRHRGPAGPDWGGDRGPDGEKLRDLGLIFGAYEAMTARGPLDPPDKLTRLAENCGPPLLSGKDVYLDGVTDFTPPAGPGAGGHPPPGPFRNPWPSPGGKGTFLPGQKTIASVKRLAAKPASRWRRPFWKGRPRGGRPPAHLEANLFAPAPAPYEGAWDGSVTVRRLLPPQEEVAWAAGEIRALAQSGRYRYRDIAVAARSMAPYWEQLEETFAQYDIPLPVRPDGHFAETHLHPGHRRPGRGDGGLCL